MVRTLVEASFPHTPLVPRDVVFGDYAEWGGPQVSWTAACYVLGADFADQMPNDEDPMPLDGNPHPMPSQLQPNENFWAVPPYPALGWNDITHPWHHDQPHQHQDEQQDGWGPWDALGEEPAKLAATGAAGSSFHGFKSFDGLQRFLPPRQPVCA